MTFKESVTLSPWCARPPRADAPTTPHPMPRRQKFRKFGKFPAKIVLHLLLFIFLAAQVRSPTMASLLTFPPDIHDVPPVL